MPQKRPSIETSVFHEQKTSLQSQRYFLTRKNTPFNRNGRFLPARFFFLLLSLLFFFWSSVRGNGGRRRLRGGRRYGACPLHLADISVDSYAKRLSSLTPIPRTSPLFGTLAPEVITIRNPSDQRPFGTHLSPPQSAS